MIDPLLFLILDKKGSFGVWVVWVVVWVVWVVWVVFLFLLLIGECVLINVDQLNCGWWG